MAFVFNAPAEKQSSGLFCQDSKRLVRYFGNTWTKISTTCTAAVSRETLAAGAPKNILANQGYFLFKIDTLRGEFEPPVLTDYS